MFEEDPLVFISTIARGGRIHGKILTQRSMYHDEIKKAIKEGKHVLGPDLYWYSLQRKFKNFQPTKEWHIEKHPERVSKKKRIEYFDDIEKFYEKIPSIWPLKNARVVKF